jgi:hypothetical protein
MMSMHGSAPNLYVLTWPLAVQATCRSGARHERPQGTETARGCRRYTFVGPVVVVEGREKWYSPFQDRVRVAEGRRAVRNRYMRALADSGPRPGPARPVPVLGAWRDDRGPSMASTCATSGRCRFPARPFDYGAKTGGP